TRALWGVRTGKRRRRVTGLEKTTSCVAFSPDGRRLVVGNLQRLCVQLFDAATGKELRRFRSWPSVRQVVFAPDGKSLLAGRTLGTVSVWDVETGKPRPAAADPDNGAFALRFTRDGLLVVASDVAVHDWRTGKVVRRHADPREEALARLFQRYLTSIHPFNIRATGQGGGPPVRYHGVDRPTMTPRQEALMASIAADPLPILSLLA